MAGWPFRLSHLLEFVPEERIQEILNIVLVLDVKCRPIVQAETELPHKGMKSRADFPDEVEGIVQCASAGPV
jgi:hypothetical protein